MIRRGGKAIRSVSSLHLQLPLGGVPVSLRRSNRRRTLALRVGADGGVVVNAPLSLPLRDIEQFVARHADWVAARLQVVRSETFVWREGADLPFLGESLRLQLHHETGPARRAGEVLICGGDPTQVEQRVIHWYRREARTLLPARLGFHAARAGLEPPAMRLSNARTRWGSLSANGVVSLNWRLIKATPEQLDYVVCHELAHFRQRNHSAAFWREVERLFPDFVRVRGSLREAGRRYFAF